MLNDQEYISTKAIRQGEQQLSAPFSDLADRIMAVFGVRPLNIIYDILEHNQQPRLQIICERNKEKKKLWEASESNQDTDIERYVNNFFKELAQNDDRFRWKNLYLLVDAFEPTARLEANSKISDQQLLALKEKLTEYPLWAIKKNTHSGIFFFYTNEQVGIYNNEETKKIFNREYFAMIKPYDEFSYLDVSTELIEMDSKAHFDTVYQSNWFYYHKDH